MQGSNHIILTVTDVERSAEWYKRVFVADVVADEKTNLAATSRPVRYRALFQIDTMTNVVGLIEHSWVDAGGGVMISTSVFEDQASEEESNRKAADWVRQNDMAAVMPNPPHITAGEVVSYKTK